MRAPRTLLVPLACLALLAPSLASAAPVDLPEGVAYQDSRDERVGSTCGGSAWTYRITLTLRAGIEGDRVRLRPLGHLWAEAESAVATPGSPASLLVYYPTTCADLAVEGVRVAALAPYDLTFQSVMPRWP